MICPKCNKDVKKIGFCPFCGENIEQYLKNKKDEKKRKVLKIKVRIAIVLFIILIILLVLLIVPNIYYLKNNFKYSEKNQNSPVNETINILDKVTTNDYIVETEDYKFELTDENKLEDADEDGLTNEEEIEAGTLPTFKDSDGDGLTDYEELKIYNTNPLKYSTSDDDISDYIKIKKDLDVNKKYSKGEVTIENKEISSKITLIPNSLESEVLGTLENFSKDSNVNSIENKFTIYNFEGKIEYKLDKVDVVLLVCYNGMYTEFDNYSIKSDKMTINIDENDNSKVFVITTKENYKNYLEKEGKE